MLMSPNESRILLFLVNCTSSGDLHKAPLYRPNVNERKLISKHNLVHAETKACRFSSYFVFLGQGNATKEISESCLQQFSCSTRFHVRMSLELVESI